MQYFIHIQTNATKAGVFGTEELPAELFGIFSSEQKTLSALKVKVSAQAIAGAANRELIQIISSHLKVPKSKIEIIRGERGKYKVLSVG